MRLESKVKVTRLAKYALFAYIFISLFYTSNHYFTSHHRDIQTSTSSTAAAAAAAAAGRDQSTGEYLSSYPQEKLSGSKPIVLKKNDNKRPITTNVNVETHNSDQVTWPGSKGTNKQTKIITSLLTLIYLMLLLMQVVTKFIRYPSNLSNPRSSVVVWV